LNPALAFELARLFVEVVTAYAHQNSIKVVEDQASKEKKFKHSPVSGDYSRQFFLLLNVKHMSIFTCLKAVIVDKKLGAFDTLQTWFGVGGRGGRLQENTEILTEIAEKHNQAVNDLLTPGSDLALLARSMMATTQTFATTWHAFILAESQRLPEVGFSKEAILLLLSAQVVAIMAELQKVRVKYPSWSAGMDSFKCLTDVIWIAIKTHEVMEDMTQTGFAAHPAIVSTFMQHLTKQAVKSNVGKLIDDLKADFKKDASALKTSVSADIAKAKKEVISDTKNYVNDNIQNLIRKNPTLKK